MWRNGNAFRNWIDSSVDSGKNEVFNGPFGRPTVDNIYSIILGAVSWLWYQVILAKEKLLGYQIIRLIWVWSGWGPFGGVLNFGSSDFNQFRYVSELWLALTLSELWLALTLSELWLANKSKTILDPTNNWFEFPRSHFWFANRIDNGRIWKIKYVCIQSTDWGNNSWWFTGNYVRRDGIRETRARWTVGRSGRARSI